MIASFWVIEVELLDDCDLAVPVQTRELARVFARGWREAGAATRVRKGLPRG